MMKIKLYTYQIILDPLTIKIIKLYTYQIILDPLTIKIGRTESRTRGDRTVCLPA